MTASAASTASAPDPVEQRERLRAALAIVEQMAGYGAEGAAEAHDADAAPGGYARAAPIARRRFDALAAEASGFAAAGIAALIRYRDVKGGDCAPAAAQLAGDMRRALAAMDRLTPGE